MSTLKRVWKLLAAGLLLLTLMGMSASPAATERVMPPVPSLCQVISPNPGTINTLNAVAMAPSKYATDLWTVGSVYGANATQPKIATLAMHFDGKVWTIANTPNIGEANVLTAVTARAANDVWAVGYATVNTVDKPLVLHYTGKGWGIVNVESMMPGVPSIRLMGAITVPTPNTHETFGLVVVGYSQFAGGPTQPLVLYYDGYTWTKMDFPVTELGGKLNAITGTVLNDMWVVGTMNSNDDNPVSFLYHFDGANWNGIAKGFGTLTSVAVHNGGVFTVGDVKTFSGQETLAMRYDMSTSDWVRIQTFNQDLDHNTLTALASDGNELYAVGYAGRPDNDWAQDALVMHYDGKTFSPVMVPNTSKMDRLTGAVLTKGILWTVGDRLLPMINDNVYGRGTLVLTNNCINGN